VSEPDERPTRVLLVDDHAVVGTDLCALFDREPGIEVVGEAETTEARMYPAMIRLMLRLPCPPPGREADAAI
jgi:hypothetical protein